MTEEELELAILRRYVAQYESVMLSDRPDNKCARELSMRDVVREITGLDGKALDFRAVRLYQRLVRAPNAPLRHCADGTKIHGEHKLHARAFMVGGREPAWERIRELERDLALSRPASHEREREQKFGLLWSAGQAQADFEEWAGSEQEHTSIGVLFIDIDDFKSLNTRFTEVRVDKAILVPFQELLRRLTAHRAQAYKVGGDEFVVQLPNHTRQEALAFANRVREAAAGQVFDMGGEQARVTVSIGVAFFPEHGEDYETVAEAAARAKQVGAKNQGKNRVSIAPSPT